MELNKKAVSLLSGGLDSTLATIIMAKLGIEVFGIQFLTAFGCDAKYSGHCVHDVNTLANRFGFHIKLCPTGNDYIKMVENPKFGYGKNMNPCVDCRIFMLKWAKDYMQEVGATFVITGEVLNQRPMSQKKFRFLEIDKEVGLEGLILRPLSAKLLPPTFPEQCKIVDREKLYAIEGRSRSIQLKLAREFGLQDDEIPQAASGCLLTDPGFSARLSVLFNMKKGNTEKDIQLMKIGRHFKLKDNCIFIVARNEDECKLLEEEFSNCGKLIKSNAIGPIGLLYNSSSEENIQMAVKILSTYIKKIPPEQKLQFFIEDRTFTIEEKIDKSFPEQFLVTSFTSLNIKRLHF